MLHTGIFPLLRRVISARLLTCTAGGALLLSLAATAPAVSVLAPGDVAITGFDGKRPDEFSFLCLVTLDAGVQLRFDLVGAGDVTWTVPAGGVAAGTVVVVLNPRNDDTPSPIPATTTVGGTVTENLYDYTSGGDALVVYQGATAIFASENLSTAYSPPAGLSYAEYTVINHTSASPTLNFNGRYVGSRTGLRQQILSNLTVPTNWQYNNNDPAGTFLNVAPYNTPFTIQAGNFWSSPVIDGVIFTAPGFVFRKLSEQPGRLDNIQNDLNDATTAATTNQCFASISGTDTIAGRRWFSVYFTNTVPAGASVVSAKIRVQHKGLSGTGNLVIHVSTNRQQTGWYTNGVGDSALVSANIPWTSTETETTYEAASVLDSADKLNNCEVLFLNRIGASGSAYFDYITIEATYQASGQPQINNDAGASAIQPASATLNGDLTQGAPNPRVFIVWGDEIGGTSTSQWDRVEDLGTIGVGPFSRTINGLLANKTYYYRCYASNTLGEAWSPTNAVFTTASPVLQFTTASSSQAEATINLTYDIVMNATSTVPVSFTVAPGGGNATAGSDYIFAPVNITIPAGRVSTNVIFRLLDDTANEVDETAVLALSAPVNATLGANATRTLTIVDNDAVPAISFYNPPFAASEGTNVAVLTVRLSTPSGNSISVQYQTQDGAALAGSDYIAANGTVTFAPGVTTNTFTVPMINDVVPESQEPFFVLLSNPINATITGTNPVAVNINDDDLGPPQINNDLGAFPVSSNSATLNGQLVSAGGYLTNVRIYFGAVDGSTNPAAWATNYLLGAVNQGSFSNRVTGLATNRTYFYRSYATNFAGQAWAPTSAELFTGPPTVRLISGSATNLESESPVSLTVSLASPAIYGEDVAISIRKSAGSATEGTDFSFPTTNAVIRAGTTSTNFTVLIVNDALNENDERFDVALSASANARLATPAALSYVIDDDDPLPLLSFVGTPYSVSENGTSITVRVNLSPVSGRFVDVDYTTVDASAIAGDDYMRATGRLTWSAGDSSTRSITIPIFNDAVSQGDRYFEFRLFDPGFAAYATSDRATITILEDDATPPQVTNAGGASDVRGSMAQLNGRVTTGIPFPQVRIYWGTINGGTNPAAWARTNFVGQPSSDFATEVRGLLPSTTYFYRSFASNPAGSDWADSSATFQTTAGKSYFVNDASLANDLYCTALGSSANSGLSASTPKDSVQAIIDTYDLNAGDTVFIDTGLYTLPTTLTLETADAGVAGPAADVMFRGTTNAAGSILDRADVFSDVAYVDFTGANDAYLTFSRLVFRNGQRGLRVLGDSSTHTRGVQVSRCVAYDNYAGSDGAISLQYCDNARVEYSNIYSNDNGVYLRNCDSATIISNRVFLHAFSGIRVRNSIAPTIAYNTAYEQNDGILVTTGFGGEQVLYNTSYSNAFDGLNITGDQGLIRGNHIYANGNDGIFLSGAGFEVSANVVHHNAAIGIDTSAEGGLTCVNNLVYLNANLNVSFWGANSIVHFEHNTLYGGNGVYWYLPWAVTNRHNIIWTTDPGHIGVDVPNIPSGDAVMLSDRNCLYATTAASVGRWGNTACSALSNWQDTSWKDPASIGVDPIFVDIGDGDFHLQSRAGSFHGGLWNVDAANSPCIDAADPAASFANEPPYNGLQANLGAEGNTSEASRTHYTGPLYTVTVATSPPGAGSAHIYPVSGTYPTNRLVTIWSSVTNSNFSWLGWGGSLETDIVTNSFYVTGNMNLTAYFEAGTNYVGPSYTVTLAASPPAAGAVYISPVLPTYPTNQLVTIWAVVTNSGYAWQAWTGSLQTTTITNTFYVFNNMTITALFNGTGSNTNGVPGWWLAGHGLPNNQAGADADTDKDGLANWKEYYAGTNPTNALSVLELESILRTTSQRDALIFQAVTGKLYRVQLSSNLLSRVWTYWPVALTTNAAPTLTPIAGTGTVMTLYSVPPLGVRPYYRVDLTYTP